MKTPVRGFAEGLEAAAEEVEAEYARLAAQYGMEVEMVKQYIKEVELRDQLCRDKAVDLIVANAVAEAPAEDEKAKKTKKSKKDEESDAADAE